MQDLIRTTDIPTQVKDPDLVKRRRRRIADAAVQLFIEKGFHKTTTRQIARASGSSIGSLYEYFASKEDILYMVCESILAEVVGGNGRQGRTGIRLRWGVHRSNARFR